MLGGDEEEFGFETGLRTKLAIRGRESLLCLISCEGNEVEDLFLSRY